MRNDYMLLVLGMRGSGKTSLTFGGEPIRGGIVQHTRPRARTFIYDERGVVPGSREWYRYERAAKLKGWLQAESKGRIPGHKTPEAYYFRPALRKSKAAFWDLVAPGETKGGKIKAGVAGTYFVDESHNLAPATGKTNEDFLEAVATGGNYSMSFVLLTRRYTQIDRTVRTQASAVLSFSQPSEEVDLMRQQFDERARAVSGLEGHEFTLFGERTSELPFADYLRSLGTYREP